MVNLKQRSFLTLKDYSQEEIRYLLDLAHKLKKSKKEGRIGKTLEGKNIVLLFEKTSTRTRCAFEVAALDEGAHVTFLSNSQMGKKESIEDTAKVLGRMYDGIEFRGFQQKTVEDLMKYSGVPVWNGLTDVDHPTQTLADFLTIEEHLLWFNVWSSKNGYAFCMFRTKESRYKSRSFTVLPNRSRKIWWKIRSFR